MWRSALEWYTVGQIKIKKVREVILLPDLSLVNQLLLENTITKNFSLGNRTAVRFQKRVR